MTSTSAAVPLAIKLSELPLTKSFTAAIEEAVSEFPPHVASMIMLYAPVDLSVNDVLDVEFHPKQWFRGRITAATLESVTVTLYSNVMIGAGVEQRSEWALSTNNGHAMTLNRYPSQPLCRSSWPIKSVSAIDAAMSWTALSRADCLTAMSVREPNAVDVDAFFPPQLAPLMYGSHMPARDGYPSARIITLYQMGYALPNIIAALHAVGEGHFVSDNGYGFHQSIINDAIRLLAASPTFIANKLQDDVQNNAIPFLRYRIDYKNNNEENDDRSSDNDDDNMDDESDMSDDEDN